MILGVKSRTRVIDLFLTAALAASGALPAFATETHQFDIPAEAAPVAVREFAAQAHVQILVAGENVKDKKLHAVSGDLSTDQGLKLLLADSGLSPQYVGDRSIALVTDVGSVGDSKIGGKDKEANKSNSGSLRLAQVDQGKASSDVPVANTDEPGQKKTEGLAEIVVTGTSIRGVYPDSSPLQTYTLNDIKATGVTTVEQFFDKFPANFNSTRSTNIGLSGVNQDGTNSLDLRGLGAGTTLILLNGRALAPSSSGRTPDVSLLPLDAIEHVEVLTDGASAVYGSNAVGGVVNFVMRKDFQGAETVASYGSVTDGSHYETRLSQTFGTRWSTGNALVSFGYFDQSPLQAADRDFSKPAGRFSLLPDDQRWSVFLSGNQAAGSQVNLYATALYSSRRSTDDLDLASLGLNPQESIYHNRDSELFLNLGGTYSLAHDLTLELTSTYTRGTQKQDASFLQTSSTTSTFGSTSDPTKDLDLTIKLDGKLVSLPAGAAKFALGGGYTNDKLDTSSLETSGTFFGDSLARTTEYAFGELFVPLVAPEQNVPAMSRLELSLSARYTHYSDFGDNTSPKIGILWAPMEGLKFRGTAAESFRAPFLTELDPSLNQWAIAPLGLFGPALPAKYGLPATANLTLVYGNNPDSQPEKARTYTAGLDWTPQAIPSLAVSLTYFDISYTGQIGRPDQSFQALGNPALFPNLFTVNPSAARVIGAISPGQNFLNLTSVNTSDLAGIAAATSLLYDDRNLNLAATKTSGVDLHGKYTHDWWTIGAEATDVFTYKKQATSTNPLMSFLNQVGQPLRLRSRAWFGVSTGPWKSQLTVNYSNGYSDPANNGQPVASWTTLDLSAAYYFPQSTGFLENFRLGLSVRNLLDKDPPYVALSTTSGIGLTDNLGYDPANGDPTGRFISLEIAKRF